MADSRLIALSLFISLDYGYLVLDIVVTQLPFAYSDLIGLSRIDMILYHRLGWFSSGLFFLFLSVLLAKRLPQSRKATNFIISSSLVLPLIIAFSFYQYLSFYQNGEAIRKETQKQIKEFSVKKTVQIIKYNLDVEHRDNEIFVTADLHYKNNNLLSLDTLAFLLNSGLHVTEISKQGKIMPFTQYGSLVQLALSEKLLNASIDSLKIRYSGSVDEGAIFAHISGDDRKLTHHIWLFHMEARHAIVSSDYLLLTPLSIWYPQTVISTTRDLLKPFAEFELKIETAPNLIAISQGISKQSAPGVFHFKHDKPVKELSLIAGPYYIQTIQLDSLDLNFYSLAKHDYYKIFFKQIADTLPAIIHEVIQDFETKVDQDYPYNRLSIIEVPIHFYSYQQNGRENVDFFQAEQIWIPENAATLTASYFKMQTERQNRFGNRSNQTYTDLEKEIMLFKRFATNTFSGSGGWGFGAENLFSFIPDLNMYPLFMNFSLTLSNVENAGIAIALEANHKKIATSQIQRKRWAVGELTDEEKANIALSDTSLNYIIQHAADDLLNKVMVVKGSYLLKQIEYVLGEENFNNFMHTVIRANLFKTIPAKLINEELDGKYGFDLEKALINWINDDNLPGFQFSSLEKYQIRDENQLRYQVSFNVNNPTTADGLIEVELRYPGEGRYRFMGQGNFTTEKWLYKIDAGDAQKIGLVLDSEPRSIKINTLISQNLPSVFTFMFEDAQLKTGKKAFEGQKSVNWIKLLRENEGLIIDNTAEGFDYVHPQYRSQLKAWIHKDAQKDKEEYDFFRWWHAPSQWQKLKFPSFYGEFIHSAYYARSGFGERKATWIGPIPDDGFYEVYVHVPDASDFRVGRNQDRDHFGIQKYTIFHADGEDEIEIDFSNAKPGWNYMETYFFKEGQARMELTDESGARMVLADAVKWELKN